MIEPGNFLAGTSLFNDKIINASANEMWKFMSEEVRTVEGRESKREARLHHWAELGTGFF